jgi:crotonobetainyl-CoA:carnitine CoA-transferase CaiB-like acyl-CoA transferase
MKSQLLPLKGFKVLSLANNLPGPTTAKRLGDLGAKVISLESPQGDMLQKFYPKWYDELRVNFTVHQVDLKSTEGQKQLTVELESADLLLTVHRPESLKRLGIEWSLLQTKYPKVCWVEITAYPSPNKHLPGHDLNFQAAAGLLAPPQMPTALLADFLGVEQAVQSALGLLWQREKTGQAHHQEIALAECAKHLALPLSYGAVLPDGKLGGALPGYNIYPAKTGWVALGAIEERFQKIIIEKLAIKEFSRIQLETVFKTRTAEVWEKWAVEVGVPLNAVKGWS